MVKILGNKKAASLSIHSKVYFLRAFDRPAALDSVLLSIPHKGQECKDASMGTALTLKIVLALLGYIGFYFSELPYKHNLF